MSKISEIRINEVMGMPLLLLSVEECATQEGNPYCICTLSDGADTVAAKYWQRKKEDLAKFPEKGLVYVELKNKPYNDKPGYIVNDMKEAEPGLNIFDFIVHAPYDSAKMYDAILGMIENNVGQTDLYMLTKNIYEKYRDKLMYWGAAKKMHHAVHGGLLWHTAWVVRNAELLFNQYKDVYSAMMDKKTLEVLLCSAALHDIGKLFELETDALGVSDYTSDIAMYGHLYISARIIEEEIFANPALYDKEKTRRLLHCILSHHGKMEWGAIKVPATVEAYLLFMADYIDSKMFMWDEIYKGMAPGELGAFNNKVGATPYRPLD